MVNDGLLFVIEYCYIVVLLLWLVKGQGGAATP